jgi:hypothetical protein
MGHISHHAIVVTSWDRVCIEKAHEEANKIFKSWISPISPLTPYNNYCSFFVASDGCKSGWPQAFIGDAARNAFIAWLDSQKYDDGSSSYEWFEAQYGSDDDIAIISRHAWKADKVEAKHG